MFVPGLDLNFEPLVCHPARNLFAGVIDASGQAGLCAIDGASAADNLPPLCGALRWTSQDMPAASCRWFWHKTGRVDHSTVISPMTGRPNDRVQQRGRCEDFMPRKAVMPAPSAATAGSACPWLVEHHRTTS